MTTSALPQAPEAIRALSSITDPDYTDTFTLAVDDAANWTAEQWARVCFDEVAGWKAWLLWRFALRLRLSRRGKPGTICGWRVGAQAPDWIRLETEGRMAANLIIRVTEDGAQLATIVRFTHPKAAGKWDRMRPMHNDVVPDLVADTHGRLRSRAA